MTCEVESTVNSQILEAILHDKSDGIRKALEMLLNEAFKVDRQGYLNAKPYERSDARVDYANGFKPKTLKSRVGELELLIPQVRGGDYYPACLERGSRSERALLLACAEMYVQGVSTRKVKEVMEELCGIAINSSDVSRATAKLDVTLKAWRERPIGVIKYLYIDARYEKVRQSGIVVDCAVLIAQGVTDEGRRVILGVSVSLSEAEPHWRKFFESLVARGMHGVELIISDAHSGLKAARQAVFPSVPWQRCQFHLQQNAQSHVPKQSLKKPVAGKIRAIFDAENRMEADRLLSLAVSHYEKEAPDLSNWMEANIPESLTVFSFPNDYHKRLRTSNSLERINREIRRRTRVASIFPNTASCERLVTAILVEISDEWEVENKFIDFQQLKIQ